MPVLKAKGKRGPFAGDHEKSRHSLVKISYQLVTVLEIILPRTRWAEGRSDPEVSRVPLATVRETDVPAKWTSEAQGV